MKHQFPKEVKSNFEGYRIFIDLNTKTRNLKFDELILDFKDTQWFDANLSAVLGALLSKIHGNGLNKIALQHLNEKTKGILSKNQFMSHFGMQKLYDYYNTTIEYMKFKITDTKYFIEYLDNRLFSKQDMPNMTPALKKETKKSILEVFQNAIIHGNCENIFSCGQYYPKDKRLDFTIVDLGNTIKHNVNQP